jgi:hypothetical protein
MRYTEATHAPGDTMQQTLSGLAGVAIDPAALPGADAVWLSWWGTGWLDDYERALLAQLRYDPAALAVCLTQPREWSRLLLSRREAVAAVTVDALRDALAVVERSAPPEWRGVEGSHGPTPPEAMVPDGVCDRVWLAGALSWSWRLWWLGEQDGKQAVGVVL